MVWGSRMCKTIQPQNRGFWGQNWGFWGEKDSLRQCWDWTQIGIVWRYPGPNADHSQERAPDSNRIYDCGLESEHYRIIVTKKVTAPNVQIKPQLKPETGTTMMGMCHVTAGYCGYGISELTRQDAKNKCQTEQWKWDERFQSTSKCWAFQQANCNKSILNDKSYVML